MRDAYFGNGQEGHRQSQLGLREEDSGAREPGEEAFDFPASPGAPEHAAILRGSEIGWDAGSPRIRFDERHWNQRFRG